MRDFPEFALLDIPPSEMPTFYSVSPCSGLYAAMREKLYPIGDNASIFTEADKPYGMLMPEGLIVFGFKDDKSCVHITDILDQTEGVVYGSLKLLDGRNIYFISHVTAMMNIFSLDNLSGYVVRACRGSGDFDEDIFNALGNLEETIARETAWQRVVKQADPPNADFGRW